MGSQGNDDRYIMSLTPLEAAIVTALRLFRAKMRWGYLNISVRSGAVQMAALHETLTPDQLLQSLDDPQAKAFFLEKPE